MNRDQKHTLKSADKLFRILEYALANDDVTTTDVAEGTSLNRSTVHVHLQTLTKHGYLVQHDAVYRPSIKFLWHGERVRSRLLAYQKGREEVDVLATKTGELVNMAILEADKVHLLYIAEGDKAIHNHLPGKEMPIHASAVGKSILAHLPHSRQEDLLETIELAEITENTITSETHLREELQSIKSQGYAVDAEEGGLGIRCIAAPINLDEETAAAVSITGPAKRIGGEYEESLRTEITNLANVIEVKIKYG